jgi:hypothetical protein
MTVLYESVYGSGWPEQKEDAPGTHGGRGFLTRHNLQHAFAQPHNVASRSLWQNRQIQTRSNTRLDVCAKPTMTIVCDDFTTQHQG